MGVAQQEAANRKEALRLLDGIGLAEAAGQAAGQLSYGQQKLLALACCLATGARVLLLDEPFAGIQPVTISRILDIIRHARADGKLVVFIEHDLDAVRLVADRVIVMDAGRVVTEGEPHDVLSRPRSWRCILPEASSEYLRIVGLVAGYGDKTVLNSVSLSLRPGEVVAVIGHNGAGKSTLLKAAFGLLPLQGGQIILFGARSRHGPRRWSVPGWPSSPREIASSLS